jgi:hypothetical protein
MKFIYAYELFGTYVRKDHRRTTKNPRYRYSKYSILKDISRAIHSRLPTVETATTNTRYHRLALAQTCRATQALAALLANPGQTFVRNRHLARACQEVLFSVTGEVGMGAALLSQTV